MTHRDDWLKEIIETEITETTEISIIDYSCKSNKIEHVEVNLLHGKSRTVSNGMYVPQLFTNLLS